jgi:hypothetical protein
MALRERGALGTERDGAAEPDDRAGGAVGPVARVSGAVAPEDRADGAVAPVARVSGAVAPEDRADGAVGPADREVVGAEREVAALRPPPLARPADLPPLGAPPRPPFP